MKLRSGKIKPYAYKVGILPQILEKDIDEILQRFKNLPIDNIQHTRELLSVVSNATSTDSRFIIRAKIAEKYNSKTIPDSTVLEAIAGGLAWIVTGDSNLYKEYDIKAEYKGIIQTKIENFIVQEMHLLGSMEE